MACSHRTIPKSRNSKVFRSTSDKVFAGVCGGLGDHFGVSSNWLRAGFVVGAMLTQGLALILYVICIFLMPREDWVRDGVVMSRAEARAARRANRHGHNVKGTSNRFRTREEVYAEMNSQFDRIEQKVRVLEDYVTSKEYVLKRKFEELG
jgi:phage shock protein PspC (stress-responsive transcriptional regulator)